MAITLRSMRLERGFYATRSGGADGRAAARRLEDGAEGGHVHQPVHGVRGGTRRPVGDQGPVHGRPRVLGRAIAVDARSAATKGTALHDAVQRLAVLTSTS